MAAAISLSGSCLASKRNAQCLAALELGKPYGPLRLLVGQGELGTKVRFHGKCALGIRAQSTTTPTTTTLVRAAPVGPAWRQGGSLASRWREVAGENNWEGMLDPLDADLRREITRLGSFIPVLYDGMDTAPTSKNRGSARYHPTRLLEKLNLPGTGYTVTKYLYLLSDADFLHDLGSFIQVPEGDDDGEFWTKDSNWIGMVAVATDPEEIKRLGRRDIVVAFRGTNTSKEWALNVFNLLWPMQPADDKVPWTDVVKVEAGFLKMYSGKDPNTPYNKRSLGEQVDDEVRRLVDKFKGEELSISITGHSLGGALSVLCAYNLAHSGVNRLASQDAGRDVSQDTEMDALRKVVKETVQVVKALIPGVSADKAAIPTNFLPGTIPITVFTFGSPRVGNDDFRDGLHALGVKVLRMENEGDVVPKLPGFVFNEWHVEFLDKWLSLFFDSFPWTYIHVGTALPLHPKHSPYLSKDADFMAFHDVEVYLHLIDGFEGKDKLTAPKVQEPWRRPYVLVNKGGSLLHPDLKVPEAWLQSQNKGVTVRPDGSWWIHQRDEIDEPQNFRQCVDI
eukprot:TRINITY_DN34_c0_g1_i6.p1 TRINITY_DN34_c0_g1~~TRINITY_DN34_c0_g1_i6.p1  ORF type:complete len:574 (-),score=81.53 TRINITY_DN34_c0_g1_i6:485-2176(-)